ncbi:MAG TPA: hypothetical protein VF268_12685 [Gammaproteobacteria bacterium]
MNTVHILSLEALAILALLIAVMLTDDPLNPEAEAWLEIANNTEDVDGNGYYYLLGIAAEASDEPEVFGRQQLAAYREAEAVMRKDGSGVIDFSWEEPLPLPRGDAYCHNNEDGCLQRLFDNPEAIRRELETQAILLDRYREFIRLPAFKTLTWPNYYEAYPPYQYVSRGNRLVQLQAILDVMQGNRSGALEALYRDIENIRRHLILADSLIYKLVLTMMLANNLELLANVYDSSIDPPMPLGLLTDDERSLHRPMIREFGMSANTLLYMNENPRTLGEELDIPHWMVGSAFKPHMTVNDVFRIHSSIDRLALFPPPAFYQHINADLPTRAPFSLRNFIGWLLGLMASSDAYSIYVARLNDIDCKIALVNAVLPLTRTQWMEMMQGSTAVPAVHNPYDPAQRPYIDAETQSLCFNGPYEDERGHRCVKKYRVNTRQGTAM